MCEKKTKKKNSNNIPRAGIPFVICIRTYAFFARLNASIRSFSVVDKWAIFAPLCCELFLCFISTENGWIIESDFARMHWAKSLEIFYTNNFEKRPHESNARAGWMRWILGNIRKMFRNHWWIETWMKFIQMNAVIQSVPTSRWNLFQFCGLTFGAVHQTKIEF